MESPERWGFSLKVRTLIGTTDTASGQVLMAFQEELERKRMLKLHIPVDGELPVVAKQLAADPARIKERGHTRMPSRQVKGVKNLAYPVFGRNGHAIAPLTTPFMERFDQAPVPKMNEVAERRKAAVQTLIGLMGLNVYWEPGVGGS
ncbi:hypothetical protein SBC1_33840 [Caballeronia sp. SBC1]|uniref:IclR family transcriptional regulator C-terminal domain-containing protein n=1 Tax=unclassified Caballeronia TaxID=2646786 RepID=UPI0013E119ED|nr:MULTISPECIES: IclR family transcriptional regulator C-terminal domain-containing protein [unclassified Caballeronia]QIE25299.1 hypothetical protein SBC2_33680 [Caballeronia sp. SBC2]QIN63345.1 hypothetical protein SBC1_33840 [Caballeronia sp. SBC1]